MDMYFYLDTNNQQQGPVNAEDLPRYGVGRETKVWKQGMGDWQEAGSIPELEPLFASSVTPPPVYNSVSSVTPPAPQAAPLYDRPKETAPLYDRQEKPAPKKPDDMLVWSIMSTILCCIPTGIVAIVYSSKVNTAWNEKDYDAAYEASRNAKTWSIVSLVLGVVSYIVFGILSVVGALA